MTALLSKQTKNKPWTWRVNHWSGGIFFSFLWKLAHILLFLSSSVCHAEWALFHLVATYSTIQRKFSLNPTTATTTQMVLWNSAFDLSISRDHVFTFLWFIKTSAKEFWQLYRLYKSFIHLFICCISLNAVLRAQLKNPISSLVNVTIIKNWVIFTMDEATYRDRFFFF